MKRIRIEIVLVTLGVFLVVGCNEEAKHDDHSSHSAATKADPVNCVVSGEPLGSMGQPIVVEHGGVSVKLCCKSCIKEFESDPDKFIAMLRYTEGRT